MTYYFFQIKGKKKTYDLKESLLKYSVRTKKIVEQLPNDARA